MQYTVHAAYIHREKSVFLLCMHSLFPDTFPHIPDAQVSYKKEFYAFAKANSLLSHLLESTNWQQNKICVYDKEYLEPRLTAVYSDPNIKYSYSGIQLKSQAWTDIVLQIKHEVEEFTKESFNLCLINLYRNGQDSNGWHADNEPELGINPVIASISLGAERHFHLQHNTNKEWRYKLPLHHGSLLLMKGTTQHTYKHQIAKTKKPIKERINLTFRKIQS